jgi:hypothetical protein
LFQQYLESLTPAERDETVTLIGEFQIYDVYSYSEEVSKQCQITLAFNF